MWIYGEHSHRRSAIEPADVGWKLAREFGSTIGRVQVVVDDQVHSSRAGEEAKG
jgi:orotate phosphoribosyltransferase-like protein